MDDLDAADRAFVDSLLPERAIATGLVAVLTFMNEEGEHCWKAYHPVELPCSVIVGLLELAKLHVISRSTTGITFPGPEED